MKTTLETKEFAERLSTSSQMDSEAIRELLRTKCRASLYFLVKAVLGTLPKGGRDLTAGCHRPLCYEIQDTSRRRKLLEFPRNHLKTTCGSRGFPLWRLIQKPDPPHFWGPDERILLTMSGGPVASVQIQAIENQLESNPLLQWLFPELIPKDFQSALWNMTAFRVANASGSEPSVSIGGVDTKVTGMHYTGIIEDDLIDETIANSVIEIQRRIAWHQYAFPLLEDPKRDWMLTIGNRWGRMDVDGWIRQNEPGCYIMHASAIVREDGKPDRPLWPERYSLEDLDKLRAVLGPAKFNAQYMNDPKDSEGAAFRQEWLRYYEIQLDPYGDKILVLDDGETVPVNTLWLTMTVDPAATAQGDRTGVVITGIDKKGRIFILEARGIRKDAWNALNDVYSIYEQWRPPRVGIEATSFQRLLLNPLARLAKSKARWMPIIPIKGSQASGAKEARINQVVGETFASGRAYLRRNMTDFLDEYSWFPDPTTTDDVIDAYALSDQLWVFPTRNPKDTDDWDSADAWAKRAKKAGANRVTGY